jgi:hypothetical protein
MQRYTLLGVPSPIIRSANNYLQHLVLSYRYCYLPLLWKRWNWFECAVGDVLNSTPSSGAHTTVSTASGICHTVTAICRYRGRDGTGLSVLWVAYCWQYDNSRCRRYSCLRSWWWVMVNPKQCNVASSWIYIRILLRWTDPWTLKYRVFQKELYNFESV